MKYTNRGYDTVQEFLACGILPLSDNWSLEVERAEAPLSKVVVPLPKAPTKMSERQTLNLKIILRSGQPSG
jgi:hypothetical protein